MLRRTDSVVASRPPLQDSIKSRANRAKKHSRAAIFDSALDVSFAGSPLQNSTDDFVMTSWRWSWRGYSKSITENMCCNCGEGACAIKDREAFMSQENPPNERHYRVAFGELQNPVFLQLDSNLAGTKIFQS